MTINEQYKLKKQEIYDIHTSGNYKDLADIFTALAKKMLVEQIEARIDEVEDYRTYEASLIRSAKLKNDLATLKAQP